VNIFIHNFKIIESQKYFVHKRKDIGFIKDLALQRIEILFENADKTFLKDPQLAQKYVNLALRIAQSSRIKIPKKYKLRICKFCKNYLWPGINATIRLRTNRQPHIVIKCHACGRIARIPYKPQKAK